MADQTTGWPAAGDVVHAPAYASQNSTDLETWRTVCGRVPTSLDDFSLIYSTRRTSVTCRHCRDRARRELADFDPSTGHLHDCVAGRLTGGYLEGATTCNLDCARHLYALAQDAEAALARVAAVLTEWDALSKHETGTTQRIRQAMTGGQHG